jgi:hypothetical protein
MIYVFVGSALILGIGIALGGWAIITAQEGIKEVWNKNRTLLADLTRHL